MDTLGQSVKKSASAADVLLDNESALDADGWALIAPYGEWPKTRVIRQDGRTVEQRFIQVLDNEAAEALMRKENGLFRRLKRALVGVPVFKGHPDLALHAPETLANKSDSTPIGIVDKVRRGVQGIEAHFSLLESGAAAVENEGRKYPSALWRVQPYGERDGAILARPFQLLSVGLTAHPNISGVESLANSRVVVPDAGSQTKTHDMKLIAGWLLANGVTLANSDSPTEKEVLDAIQKLVASKSGEVTSLGNEKSNLSGKIIDLEKKFETLGNEKTSLTTEKAALSTKVTALENSVNAERKGRAAATVDLAIASGRLAVAQRETAVATLANCADETAYEAESKKLLTAARVVRTASDAQSGKVLANDMSDDNCRQTYFDAVNKHMNDHPGVSISDAHAAVLKAHPALADALKARGDGLKKS